MSLWQEVNVEYESQNKEYAELFRLFLGGTFDNMTATEEEQLIGMLISTVHATIEGNVTIIIQFLVVSEPGSRCHR